jgi:hypothetical protein
VTDNVGHLANHLRGKFEEEGHAASG